MVAGVSLLKSFPIIKIAQSNIYNSDLRHIKGPHGHYGEEGYKYITGNYYIFHLINII